MGGHRRCTAVIGLDVVQQTVLRRLERGCITTSHLLGPAWRLRAVASNAGSGEDCPARHGISSGAARSTERALLCRVGLV